jgi:dihydroorotate dehydrogenase electron transfer subunit
MYDDTVAVLENRPLTGGHFLLSLHSPRQAKATRPGQFAMVRLLGRSDVLLRRPMSIFDVRPGIADCRLTIDDCKTAATEPSAPGSSPAKRELTGEPRDVFQSPIDNRQSAIPGNRQSAIPEAPAIIQLLYKVVGRGTRLMAELGPGDQVGLLAPLGHGFFAEEYFDRARAADEVLHVAGGIGIAALLLAARQLAAAGLRQRLFFGGRTRDDLVGVDEFAPYAHEIAVATEDGSRGHRGYVTRPLEEYLAGNRRKKFLMMACGPWAMLEATVERAKRYGHACLVSMENRMGCGLGVCLGCSIRVHGTGHGTYERVCTEGPVFWAEKVI